MPEVPAIRRPMGRPKGVGTVFTQEMAEALYEWTAEGKTLASFLRYWEFNTGQRISRRTVDDWTNKNSPNYRPDFDAEFGRARVLGYAALSEEIKDISDTPCIGTTTIFKQVVTKHGDIVDVVEQRQGDMTEHRKLQMYSREKVLQMWSTKYNPAVLAKQALADGTEDDSNKIVIEGGLPDDGNPLG